MIAESSPSEPQTRMPRLMENHPSAAYQAGRLLAVCQLVQDADERDINATFTDRYFTAASSCPARVLPRIVEITLKRIRKLFQTNPRQAADLRFVLSQIHTAIEHRMPGQLNMVGKADFQLGYFHQHACRIAGYESGKTRYRSNDGKSVKSRGELRLANLFAEQKIQYLYEPNVDVPQSDGPPKPFQPDFVIENGEHRLFIEYLGMTGIQRYDASWRGKLRQYESGLNGRLWIDVQTDQRVTELTVFPITPDELVSPGFEQLIIETIQHWLTMVEQK